MLIDYQVDADGIATITWNMTDYPMNLLNDRSVPAFAERVHQAIADAQVKGVMITSAKQDFIAGADLNMLLPITDAQSLRAAGSRLQSLLREMETCGKPFVAAINGTALGGGYEICLACHYRVAADNPRTQIGLPEVLVGLLPGSGGTQRLPRMIGARMALPLMLEGKKLKPKKALDMGLVDKLVAPDALLAEAKNWLLKAGPNNTLKPWDKKGFKLPGGAVQSPQGYETFVAGNALLHEKTFGNYPAPLNIMSCVYEGCQVDMDTGLRIETSYFVQCALSAAAKNMIRSVFFSIGEANKLASRPKEFPPTAYKKIGILGAGMMGAGIATVSAEVGLEVVLLDATQAAADKGKAHAQQQLAKKLTKGQVTQAEHDQVLARIHPTTDYAQLAGCELVIEAVFEDRQIKAEVTRKTEAVIPAECVFASNTSTLPITGLAEASTRPENFIGLHFFSPVEKMPLVEIILGKRTGQACLAKAMDYVKKIRKTPIVVNDSRGFYTSRVFATYVNEGMALLAEGVLPALIENAGRQAGMPVGPLALADEVSIELMYRIRKQTAVDLGDRYQASPADPVVLHMVDDLGRLGKKIGKGFYDYPKDGKKHLWTDLKKEYPPAAQQPSVQDIKRRLLYVQSLETVRCLEEGVLFTPQDADVGSILGWGVPPYLGGTISQIHTLGIPQFVAQCEQLATQHGARFKPPKLLRDMAAQGKAFYPA